MTNLDGFAIIILAVAAMAQLVEHILGKDEVPSSNLGSSSKNPFGVSRRDFSVKFGYAELNLQGKLNSLRELNVPAARYCRI